LITRKGEELCALARDAGALDHLDDTLDVLVRGQRATAGVVMTFLICSVAPAAGARTPLITANPS
jgi:hypothetical protein